MAEKDILTGQEKDTLLQGHDADGITEFDNDMPLWWLVGFIFTVVFSFGYLVQYHMADGPSSKKEYEEEIAAFNKSKEPAGATQEIVYTPMTDAASLDAGKTIFNGATNTCFTCHRNDLGGIVGPNLTDEFWIHGGDLKSIMKSIKTGYPDKGMQPFGTNARLSDRQVLQVASYILSQQGSNPANPKPIDPARELKFVAEAEKTVAEAEKPKDAAAAKPAPVESADKAKVAKK
ncbi:MAG TPA: cbb3-type cytochrome c oxidase N-terminal domain-containing protein [Blastocatellia bacterium]|nr:cbb3-type cytochrome c oxidase N-terminal domain-containing protein [Blastocatellia bacterium]